MKVRYLSETQVKKTGVFINSKERSEDSYIGLGVFLSFLFSAKKLECSNNNRCASIHIFEFN